MAAVHSPAIVVGGRVVRDPAHAIVRYLERHGGTVIHYDFRAATFDQINLDLVRATRSPWMGSRISAKEAAWIIGRGIIAPWAAIPLDAQLKEADPLAEGGLYDQAAALWGHFWDARPANVSTAKISKVLYLMRPELFPILDSYLTNDLQLWKLPRSRPGLARKPSSRPGWYCIRLSRVLTSAVSWPMSCLTRLASDRFRTDQTGSTGFSSGA